MLESKIKKDLMTKYKKNTKKRLQNFIIQKHKIFMNKPFDNSATYYDLLYKNKNYKTEAKYIKDLQ